MVYTAAARRDVSDILRYITHESRHPPTAWQFVEAIDQHCRKLAALPGTLGRARPELRPDIRSTPFRGYIIFFRYAEDRLEVINILNAHKDIAAHFQE
ncbi:type II toxin-antitoxin system RelE/ParE family toxin [Niveispirillum sp. KHB5.9]|uniref:type II toxin-antitoxin system RelE/ParE family toxin n=1 Tax=Niveispirillum sp. KHB5.9 TaxID=3400269 RepID=UPI003A8B3747